ncbi:MAG: thioredoxin domain-containing protein [Campylobacterota bacterium]|nr:thioredoxin domain-containing protein [Campylobacterota bacterium]
MAFELTDENYVTTVEDTKVAMFIDFYSPTCGPCQEIQPLMDLLEAYFGDRALICKVNVQQNPKLAKKYEIKSVPFCVSVGEDKMIKDYELGAGSIDRYIRMVEKAIGEKGFFRRMFG